MFPRRIFIFYISGNINSRVEWKVSGIDCMIHRVFNIIVSIYSVHCTKLVRMEFDPVVSGCVDWNDLFSHAHSQHHHFTFPLLMDELKGIDVRGIGWLLSMLNVTLCATGHFSYCSSANKPWDNIQTNRYHTTNWVYSKFDVSQVATIYF